LDEFGHGGLLLFQKSDEPRLSLGPDPVDGFAAAGYPFILFPKTLQNPFKLKHSHVFSGFCLN
jgi:hypothetical protein